MTRNLDPLNRYIHAVRWWLPPSQKDAALELFEDLLGQIEDREAELGRPMADAEVSDLLQRCGHPLIVASRYLPEERKENLVYRAAFRQVALWIAPLLALTGVAWLSRAAIGPWLLPLTAAAILSAAMFALGFLVSMKFWSRTGRPHRRSFSTAHMKELL